MRRCSTCRQDLPEDQFDRTPKSADGLAYWCRDCRARYHRSYKSAEKRYTGKSRLSWEERLWYGARKRAEDAGLAFDIEVSDIVIPEQCPVIGTRLMRASPGLAHRASLDRIDNARGYVKGNVAVISSKANTLKSNLSIAEIGRLARYVGV
jgi:hypothetical protein